MNVEEFRRKITKLTPAKYVMDYRYELECGHVAGGKGGETHAQARRRKTWLCQDCRMEAERAARS